MKTFVFKTKKSFDKVIKSIKKNIKSSNKKDKTVKGKLSDNDYQ